ncbi:MAG TPA: hypothetical protein VLK26_03970 [Rudaea sp.]|nr:hypothetical protein [Rudaea sp.]
MTLCPVAVAIGCKRCPIFGICPAKSLIGDYRPEAKKTAQAESKPARKSKR